MLDVIINKIFLVVVVIAEILMLETFIMVNITQWLALIRRKTIT